MTNVKAAGRAAEARLAPLLAEAYQVFASPTPPLPLLVCSCNVCFTPDEQAAFVRFALPEIPTGYLLAHLMSVPLEVSGKVGFAEPGIYTAAELALVRDFARALVIHLCHHAEPSPPDETHLGEIIAGLACGGLGVTSELLAW